MAAIVTVNIAVAEANRGSEGGGACARWVVCAGGGGVSWLHSVDLCLKGCDLLRLPVLLSLVGRGRCRGRGRSGRSRR